MHKDAIISGDELPRGTKGILERMVKSFASNIAREFNDVKILGVSYSKDNEHAIYKATYSYSFSHSGKKYSEIIVISVDYETAM